MTISYSAEVATAKLGTLVRLLFRWKGSLYQLVWKEAIIFIALYVVVACVYQHALPCSFQIEFESWVKYCSLNTTIIPIAFVLSFFVNLIISRWWEILMAISSPSRACYYSNVAIPGDDDESKNYRRAIVRYLNLAQILVLRDVSTSVKKRFLTLDAVVASGLLTPEERVIIDNVKSDHLRKTNKYWLVIEWACDVYRRVFKDDLATSNPVLSARAFEEVIAFRDFLAKLLTFDWVCIPISYTQVVTLVVYAYFATSLIGRQFIFKIKSCPLIFENGTSTSIVFEDNGEPFRQIERYFPLFPLLEFIFYMGWLKVAVSIMNPLGDDDDDFEINNAIDENIAISYALVDAYNNSCPEAKNEFTPKLAPSTIKSKSREGSAVS